MTSIPLEALRQDAWTYAEKKCPSKPAGWQIARRCGLRVLRALRELEQANSHQQQRIAQAYMDGFAAGEDFTKKTMHVPGFTYTTTETKINLKDVPTEKLAEELVRRLNSEIIKKRKNKK